MISKNGITDAFVEKNEEQKYRQAQHSLTAMKNPVVAETFNELWIELAYEESATLTMPGVPREEAYRRADELRLQRLNLERLADKFGERLALLETDEQSEVSTSPDSNNGE